MTSSRGEGVEMWTPPLVMHLRLAMQPAISALNFFSAKRDPVSLGDGFEAERAESLRRALYSIPASCGWFAIVTSVLVVPSSWMRPIKRASLRRGVRIAGGILLVSVPLLARDFYRDATTYEGYYHLGAGAYFIVSAYALIGSSLLSRCVDSNIAEP